MEPQKKKLKKDTNCFVIYSETELKSKHDASVNINTSRSEDHAKSAFTKFLKQAGKDNLEY